MRSLAVYLLATLGAAAGSASADSTLSIRVVDETGALLPCRMHLRDQGGAPRRADPLPFWHDHFVLPGEAQLDLPPGEYQYAIERGPEHLRRTGALTLSDGEPYRLSLALPRIADLAARGWRSGDLHVHRPIDEMPLHLEAEDLYVAPVITWWNGRSHWAHRTLPTKTLMQVPGPRYYDLMAGEDERDGGALLYFGLRRPLPLPGDRNDFPEFPSSMQYVQLAREDDDVWIDVEKPFWRDVPVWLASGQVDSIGLANNHMCRSVMLEDEAWGKPRDVERLPAPRGNGFWSQEIYYHALNCGLRLPPSAGSASGVLPNPIGYNRVYVYTGDQTDYRSWWEGLRAGRCFVTNGPLLLCRANGAPPGRVFQSDDALRIDVELELISNDSTPALEIVRNGRTTQTIPLSDGPSGQHATARLEFQRSGWFLIRALADVEETFRFASTAPYYVEIGAERSRISRASVQFFLDWLDERSAEVRRKVEDPAKLASVLKYHDDARDYWRQRRISANAE